MKKSILFLATIALVGLSSPVRINASDNYWNILSVGSGHNVGRYVSFAMKQDGSWAVAYSDDLSGALMCTTYVPPAPGHSWPIPIMSGGTGASIAYGPVNELAVSHKFAGKLYFSNQSGSVWINTLVDGKDGDPSDTSLSFDNLARAGIGYFKRGRSRGLWFALRNGSKWSIRQIDPQAYAVHNQMIFDPFNNPVFAYSDASDGGTVVDMLKVARWNGAAWDISVVDAGGLSPTLAFDPVSGNLVVAHWDDTTGQLRVLSSNGAGWSHAETVDTAPSITGCSLAINSEGRVYLGYGRDAMCVAIRDLSGVWTVETLDESTTGSLRNSLKVSPSTGRPVVTFRGLPQNGYGSGVLLAIKQAP